MIERTDPTRRGKGFALDHGIRSLEPTPPDVVIIIDADCRLQAGAIDLLGEQACRTGRPAQAVYLLEPPARAGVLTQLSAFAFLFKNLVRPRGLVRLGLPCLLTGTGMAIPWVLVRSAPLASGNIVEDMQLGVDLACAGNAPKLCPGARVDGVLPSGGAAAYRQRRRWEHGHLRTLLTQVPRLLLAAVSPVPSGPAGAGPRAECAAAVDAAVVLSGHGVAVVAGSVPALRHGAGSRRRGRGSGHAGRVGPVWAEGPALHVLAGHPLLRPRQGPDLARVSISPAARSVRTARDLPAQEPDVPG